MRAWVRAGTSGRRDAQGLRTAKWVGAALATAFLAWPALGSAATLKVCEYGCAYRQIQPAVDAARAGDTVNVGPGTYRGGVSIAKSLRLVGAGPSSTTISGGNSVLTLGTFEAAPRPTVVIEGVDITHGVARTSPESIPFTGKPNVIGAGGGIEIPLGEDDSPGATVTIENSSINGNRAVPTDTAGGGAPCMNSLPCCPPGQTCPFAGAWGGGIDNWGRLTLINSSVTGNTAAGAASDADGAGIYSLVGAVTLLNTRVADNTATASAPNGRFAEGGGVDVETGRLTIDHGDISDNAVRLENTLTSPFQSQAKGCPSPCHIDMDANSGGIHVSDGVPTDIADSTIEANQAAASDLSGEANAFDGAMIVGNSPATVHNTRFIGNVVIDRLATESFVGVAGSAVEFDGPATITGAVISDNVAVQDSPDAAGATSGLAILPGEYGASQSPPTTPPTVRVTNSRITDNRASAVGGHSATITGAGVFNNGIAAFEDVVVTGNSGAAFGPAGTAQGGGIWNGVDLTGPPVRFVLTDSAITANTLTASPAISRQGGGVFTTSPFVTRNSRIERNVPDQCQGCSGTGQSATQPDMEPITRKPRSERALGGVQLPPH